MRPALRFPAPRFPPPRFAFPRAPASLWRARDGVAAVEFALIAPFLILLLGGAVSCGDALRVRIAVNGAARAGAAWALLNGFDQDRIAAAARAGTGLANLGVTATTSASACTNPANPVLVPSAGAVLCSGTGAPPGIYVSVSASVSYTFIIPLPGQPTTTTISGTALARVR